MSAPDLLRATAETLACLQGEGMPILLHGLLQHETKLSVLNFSMRKASSSVESIPNKAELLFCSGLRCAATLLLTALRDFAAATPTWNRTPSSVVLQQLLCCSVLHYLASQDCCMG